MRLVIPVLAFALFHSACFAHPGRTDANGGHNDRSSGTYHYHSGPATRSVAPAPSVIKVAPVKKQVYSIPEPRVSTPIEIPSLRLAPPEKPDPGLSESQLLALKKEWLGKNQAESPQEFGTLINGKTYVPIRYVAENLGAKVGYEGKTKTVSIVDSANVISFRIGSKKATINQEEKAMMAPAIMKNGKTLVPLRFVSESLGAKVDWDGPAKKAIIIKSDGSGKIELFTR